MNPASKTPSTPDTRALQRLLDNCMLGDQHKLRRQLRDLTGAKSTKDPAAQAAALERWQTAVDTSKAKREERSSQEHSLNYPDFLPVVAAREEIMAAIAKHQVVVVCGDTGSGKTTQLPKMCIELGRGAAGMIGHTQPRRIAARSVATRIAEETGTELGALIGFKVRFNDVLQESAKVKLMTDGILLAEIQRDPWLNGYDTIIVDEAHERSLNIDFLLGYLHQLLRKRRDLKLIITSATIDPQRFAKHFHDAPIITAEGRSYPVELRYRSRQVGEDQPEIEESTAIIEACEELAADIEGDLLVFLPGERDIRENSEALRKHVAQSKRLRGTEVLPLFGRLSAAEQQKIFSAHGNRRIVLATNVAETSLTVPGIRAVIDTGTARISRYAAGSKLQRLPIEKISQASANQRKGRCGREAPGICIRLFDEADFDARPEFTEPEILRTNLASVILQMANLRLGEMEEFPFLEPPELRYINDGYQLLLELSAVDNNRKLTRLGRQLARIPADPRLARMLIAADQEGALDEVLTIVAGLSVQDPRERPLNARQAADEAHSEYQDEKSDFIGWVNLRAWLDAQQKLHSGNQFRKHCQKRFLNYMRIREWRDLRRQLLDVTRELKMKPNSKEAHPDNIHRAILTGLLGNVARLDEKREFTGVRGRKLQIFPGSALKKRSPAWIMAAEVTETSRVFARTVAAIQPEWIEKLAQPLLKASYFDARWHRKRAQVGARAKITLYGLIVNANKKVNYGPINPSESREIFIREGLVGAQYTTQAPFYEHNLKLVEEIQLLEDKSRRRDILVDPEDLASFYLSRIPEGVYSGPSFEKWRKAFEASTPKGLHFDRDALMQHAAVDISYDSFPDQMEFAGAVLPLRYNFEPGRDDDGVTLSIPIGLLGRVNAARCEWLVPGLLEEKVTALLRSLPKAMRKAVVPVPDVARQCIQSIAAGEQSLQATIAAWLQRNKQLEVGYQDWQPEQLAVHLLMRFEVLDNEGHTLDTGRDLKLLQKKHQEASDASLAAPSQDAGIERKDIIDWNFGDLPEELELKQAGVAVSAWPALVDEGDSIALRVFGGPQQAAEAMRGGLIALYRLQLKDELKYLRRKLPGIESMALRYTAWGSKNDLIADIIAAAITHTFIDTADTPRTREAFLAQLSSQRSQLVANANNICESLGNALDANQRINQRIRKNGSLAWVEAVNDIHDQAAQLLNGGAAQRTPAERLPRLAVYFEAIEKRLDGLDKAPDRDRKIRAELLPLWERFKEVPRPHAATGDFTEQWQLVRWAFEELRISLFAQSLRTVQKVSLDRVEKDLKQLRRLDPS